MTTSGVIHVYACHPGSGLADRFLGIRGLSKRHSVLTVVSIAGAEVARPVRYLNMLLGAALMAAPLMFAAGTAATIVSVVLGVALIALSLRRGLIRERYGNWGRLIV